MLRRFSITSFGVLALVLLAPGLSQAQCCGHRHFGGMHSPGMMMMQQNMMRQRQMQMVLMQQQYMMRQQQYLQQQQQTLLQQQQKNMQTIITKLSQQSDKVVKNALKHNNPVVRQAANVVLTQRELGTLPQPDATQPVGAQPANPQAGNGQVAANPQAGSGQAVNPQTGPTQGANRQAQSAPQILLPAAAK